MKELFYSNLEDCNKELLQGLSEIVSKVSNNKLNEMDFD